MLDLEKKTESWKWVPLALFSKKYNPKSALNLYYQFITSGSIIGTSLLAVVYGLNEVF